MKESAVWGLAEQRAFLPSTIVTEQCACFLTDSRAVKGCGEVNHLPGRLSALNGGTEINAFVVFFCTLIHSTDLKRGDL